MMKPIAAVLFIFAMGASAEVRQQHRVAASVAQMNRNVSAKKLVKKYGMQILNVMWEDTGRWKGSSYGPNISDVTIEVETDAGRQGKQRHLMPVIRFPNFTDKTGDVAIDKVKIRVGNQASGNMKTITLKQFLKSPTSYMSLPNEGKIKGGSLLAKRDSHVLTSAQTAFLPVAKSSKTKFWPVVFNYQSSRNAPAVLTLLVTRQGTSMTIIDNTRDTVGSRGQRLYFNKEGQRAPLLAERLTDVKASGVTANGEEAQSLGADANLMMIVQIPLKVKKRQRGGGNQTYTLEGMMTGSSAKLKGTSDKKYSRAPDVTQAVIGHGPTEGPFTELDGKTIERDARFPVRVTVQFYQATSNGVLSKELVAGFAKQIRKVYDSADYVGSLVVPEGDETRPTLWDGFSAAPKFLSVEMFPGLVQHLNTFVSSTLEQDSGGAAGIY